MAKTDDNKLAGYLKSVHKSLSSSQPKLYTSNPSWNAREAIRDVLPKGATLMDRPTGRTANNAFYGTSAIPGASLTSGMPNTMGHMQRPYLPEWESPDREQYPQQRKKANEYWRMFHKYDPIFGNAIDMYAEMLVGDFDLVVKKDDSKEIKRTLDYMVSEVNLIDVVRHIVREFLIIGEAVPQNFFSDDKGIWTYVGFHNTDNIEVRDAPIIKMDPLINFVPDEALRAMLNDGSPDAMELRKKLPSQFVSKVISRQNIKLSPVNCSFIARKLHPYDLRGTSLASRLWRIWMVEDASYNSTIATYRRNASPLKVIKLGDPSVGWMPDPTQESKLLQLLAQAELDPNAYLIWNYGINFEAWGTNERAVNIKGDYDTIEKVKLSALGLSKSFMSGEVTFASAKSGLQVFLRRLLALRQYMESVWIYPKFFRPISEMNEWYTSKPNEGAHQYRQKRSAQALEQEERLIMPEIVWKNKLDPKLDMDLLAALEKLKNTFGFKISKVTAQAAVGIDWKEEEENTFKEYKESKELQERTLGDTMSKQYDEEAQQQGAGAKPPGAPGSGAKPPGAEGKPPGAGGGSTPPGGADKNTPMTENIEAPGSDGMPSTVE
jgi:hypothetical protein